MTLSQDQSITQAILHWIRATPEAIAVINGGTSYCYGDLGVMVVQCVKALSESLLQPGMLAGISCDNRYVHLSLILACEVLGATSVSLSANDLVAGDLVAGDPVLRRLDFLCAPHFPPGLQSVTLLPLHQGGVDRIVSEPVRAPDFDLLDRCPADTAVLRLVKTSGSTGRPKIMAMTWAKTRAINERSLYFGDTPAFAWNFINLYDFTLRSAWIESAIALRTGATIVSSSMATLLPDMRRFGQFHVTLVSGDAMRLSQAIPADWQGRRDGILSVKGGMLAPEARARLQSHVVRHVMQEYGTLEVHRLAWMDAAGLATKHPDVSIRVMREDGTAAATGETGTIEARSGMMVDGYAFDADRTNAHFHDGWFRTNDLGVLLEDGRFRVFGRADDVVNLDGNKFSPLAEEQRIRAIEGVEDAVLIAVPGANGTDQLHLLLQSPDPSILAHIHDRLVESLAGHAKIFVPHVVSALPRTENGKVRRQFLRDALATQSGVPPG